MRYEYGTRFAITAALVASAAAAAAQQYLPPQSHPKVTWQARCGGVDPALLDQQRAAALAHVRAEGLDERLFLRRIQDCPKRDLQYYARVLAMRASR